MILRHVVLWSALVATFLPGCRDRDTPGTQVVDTELMAYLSEARALHHQANLHEASGDLASAAATIRRLVGARRPHGGRPTPEVEDVLADGYARLAELELRRQNLDAASEAVRSGLTHAPDATYFRGHLLEMDGLIEEARAATLADAGSTEEAAAVRRRALDRLEEAVRIQDHVIQRSLDRSDAGSPEIPR